MKLVLLASALGIALAAWWMHHATVPRAIPREVASPSASTATAGNAAADYVDNGRCVACHEPQAKRWVTSHHFHAMEPATAAAVRGDFGGVEFVRDGVTSRFSRRDGAFVVRTDGPDGTLADFDVAYTFGVDPLQQYLIPLPGGRLQALTIAWDTERKQWFHLYPNEKTPPGDVLHWAGRYQRWNGMCASCHSTNLRKGYDAASDTYRTTWSELDVSCQSCHGPGSRHVAWADAGSARPAGGGNGLVTDPAASADREIETCAPCHARRSELTDGHLPGSPLYDDFRPALLTEDLYYPDGQQLGEVYEYGSFRQSRMYRAGVRCTDCHDAHTARLRLPGNALCVRCHGSSPDRVRFPTLVAGAYDSSAHHFHQPGSAGARCVSCHMPTRSYMIVHARRDHAIRVPRPDLSAKIGTTDACTTCHADRSPQWAAEAVARWYGPNRRQEKHYGEILAAGRAGRPGAEAELAALVADAAQPAIVRATAVDLLGRYGPGSVGASVAAARDPDPAVRAAAVASLERVHADERAPLVAPLLADPMRAVRIEAARVLSSVPAARLDVTQRHAYDAALAEFVAVQAVSADMPGGHLNLAVVEENQGKSAAAEAEYRTALRMDPDFTPARLNLSRLLNGAGRNAEAEQVLQEGIARVPSQGELQYSLGLLLAEEQRLAEAAAALGRAADLLPGRARVRYNHALALQQLGRPVEAEAALTKARAVDPGDPGIVYALTVLHLQQKDWPHALASAEELASLAPDDPRVQRFVADVRAKAQRPDRSTE